MATSRLQIKRYRTAFGWSLAVSLLVLIGPAMYLLRHALRSEPTDASLQTAPSELLVVVAVVSLCTFAASLVGFVFATRQARREEERAGSDETGRAKPMMDADS
jgi:hypothetical protein